MAVRGVMGEPVSALVEEFPCLHGNLQGFFPFRHQILGANAIVRGRFSRFLGLV
jgi:hypothetical protein